jgi:signal transduction histidine kinase
MPGTKDAADLFVVPVAAVLETPMSAGEVRQRLADAGMDASTETVAGLLARSADLGLTRVAEHRDGEARYVATSLGQRSAAQLVGVDPDVSIGLEELERLRSDLLATVGHELRTPLTAIRTSIGLLLDPGLEPSDAQRQQLLATVGRSADRMQQLLTELLDLARLRSGRVELERAPIDARDIARDVVAAVEPMAAARDQRLVLEVPPTRVTVVGDRRRLEQAVLNLAANAQKFSDTGAEVVVRVARDGDGSVRWTVIDHGPGIAPDERVRLFERFFVGGSDQSRAGGSGIGLPTALAIAQAHGGTIEVESDVGAGSTFHLVVPGADCR